MRVPVFPWIPSLAFSSRVIRATLPGFDSANFTAASTFGSIEPERLRAAPRVFVIGGGGSGIPVYRRLHRLGIPFAAGVLHENDLDTPAAQALASRVILETAFEPIGQDKTDLALSLIEQCQYVLCPLDVFGTMNRANAALRDAAEKAGKLAADIRETER